MLFSGETSIGSPGQETNSTETHPAPPTDVVELCKETFQKTAEYLRGELDGKSKTVN